MSAASENLNLASAAERTTIRGADLVLHATIFLVAFALLVSRRPDALLNAQFYSEDGIYWYADAYHFGWRCLLLPLGGYLNSLSRIIGMFSLLFPFALAPLFMNLCALVAGILPIHIFLSSRFKSVPFNTRLLGSLLYLALPNSFELHATTTNIQWHLALAGCLVLLGCQESSRAWKIFDFLVLTLLVLDGPLGIVLIPVVLFLRWFRKDSRYNLALAALIPGAVLQLLVLFIAAPRRPAPNGATLARLINILGGQIFLSSLFGLRTLIQLFGHVRPLLIIDFLAMLVGLAILFYALWRGPIELRLFILFATAVLVLGLIHPLATTDGDHVQWEQLQVPGCGNRYYFFPMLAFLASLIWMSVDRSIPARAPRYVALVLLVFLPVGIFKDWRYRPFVDLHFKEIAADFQRAPRGTQFVIPINPGLSMTLTKQ
jgi:hypothetical protein